MALARQGDAQSIVIVENCGFSGPAHDPCELRITQNGQIETYEILQPIVDRTQFTYDRITFRPNDTFTVQAGGCVQTGGAGRTWKRYVNPSGPNSDRLYFGSMEIREIFNPFTSILAPTRFNDPRLQNEQVIPDTTQQSVLILHYADDNYPDNGYWGHDNGTEDQCALNHDGASAHVTITITRAHPAELTRSVPSETGKDWDLVENLAPFTPGEYDDNGLFFDPRWRWQQPGSNIPSFDRERAQDQSTQRVSEDSPNSLYKRLSLLCKDLPIPGLPMWGHINWFDVTVQGQVFFDHHSNPVFGDDDYNLLIVTPEVMGATLLPDGRELRAGVTSDNSTLLDVDTVPPKWRPESEKGIAGLKAIKAEFDSDEVVDADPFDEIPWWKELHDRVDSGVDPKEPFNNVKNYPEARAWVDGHQAIITGLMGLDVEHGFGSEIHPVHLLAIQMDESRNKEDDAWAIFVRNWGDEGECSKDQHFLNTAGGEIRLRIPPPAGLLPDTRATNRDPAHFQNGFTIFKGQHLGPEDLTPNASRITIFNERGNRNEAPDAVVSFRLPPASEDGGLIVGELHLSWEPITGTTERIQQPIVASSAQSGENEGEDAVWEQIWSNMSDAQRADYQARLAALLPPRSPGEVIDLTPVLVNEPPPDPVLVMPTVSGALAVRKIARDRAREQALCSAAPGAVQAAGGDCSQVLNDLQ